MVQGLAEASALDQKTAALAYLAVLAALRMESGVAFHVQTAKQLGLRARRSSARFWWATGCQDTR